MRAAVLTSTAPRHSFFLQTMANNFEVVVAMQEPKKKYYDTVQRESAAVREHFSRLKESEELEFMPHLQNPRPRIVSVETLNEESCIAKVQEANVDVILLFGTVILDIAWLRAFPGKIINLHLGLSPYYRGAATLLWPFANGEIECLGTTIHLAVERVDAGAILRRVKPDLRIGDSYYGATIRLIRHSIQIMPEVVIDYLNGRIRPSPQKLDEGRAYRMNDFNEEVLERVMAFVGAGLTFDQIEHARRSTKCACSQ